MSLLELRRISFSYPGTTKLIDNLSFTVEAGSIAAILGPNGAGKTTLLDICLGWKRPERGEVLLGGRKLESLTRRARGMMMSLVPQRENIRFEFTVTDYVLLGRAPHLLPLQAPGKEDLAIARDALKAVGMSGFRDRSIGTLSGGEYQLMLIARSLAQQASLILLDEPASQLDPGNQRLIIGMLKKLSGKGITILYTSHNPQTAAIVADTIHLLKNGRFRFSGSPREVLTEEALRRVYGVPFKVSWIRGSPHCTWDIGRVAGRARS